MSSEGAISIDAMKRAELGLAAARREHEAAASP
jgi:hypothetical protein